MGEAVAQEEWRDLYIHARDGIRLYGRHYPAPGSNKRQVLCLAGLTRNSRDFHTIASALSGSGPDARDVFTFDCRGRGLSDYAPSWKDYVVPVEMLDVQDFMASQQLHGAALLGTSRGGLITMVMAAAMPSLIGAAILNDIGPVIEQEGLLRIAGYVGKEDTPKSWEEAASRVKAANQTGFPNLDNDDWEALARQFYNKNNDGKPGAGYDRDLTRTFSLKDGPVPQLWPQFLALSQVPCLVLRGELSDLLSADTVSEMQRRHPNCLAYTVAGEGHAPLLRDKDSIGAIREFLGRSD